MICKSVNPSLKHTVFIQEGEKTLRWTLKTLVNDKVASKPKNMYIIERRSIVRYFKILLRRL